VSSFDYYMLWLTAGLVIIAIASALIARHLRQRVLRRVNAPVLLDALARYSDWVGAQRGAVLFQDDAQENGSPLREVLALRQQWFPELRAEGDEMLAMHARLIRFLQTQQQLRLQDPEAWLESDHDARFIELWRQHLQAVQGMTDKLTLVDQELDVGAKPGTTFPA
jgi:hypothetical protein